MVIVYHAANTLDANMIKQLLQQHNIPAFVLGEYLQGGVGDLPATDLVKVAVHEAHQASADNVIKTWEAATVIEEKPTINPVGDGAHEAT